MFSDSLIYGLSSVSVEGLALEEDTSDADALFFSVLSAVFFPQDAAKSAMARIAVLSKNFFFLIMLLTLFFFND